MLRLIVIMSAVLVCFGSITVGAKTVVASDYTIDAKDSQIIPIPVTHECVSVIDYIEGYLPEDGEEGTLKNPQDIFIDKNDNIYIADTGNNTVLKIDKNGKLQSVITEADGLQLSKPLGVYADSGGDIYIADNGNSRILHLSSQGEYIENFQAPESELLSQNLTVFDPAKIAINNYNGYIYMIIGKEFMTLDAENTFRGLVGTIPVGFDLIDTLVRTFATDTQKEKLKTREPLPYNNFCITDKNEIYAVANTKTSQIKKINSIGDNIYPEDFYGEMAYENGEAVYPMFSDIAVNSYGVITVAEQNSSRLYQYDEEGNLLAVFGGEGNSKGRFQTVTSIGYNSEDCLYVLDSTNNTLHRLKPTNFITQIHKAIEYFSNGLYEDSSEAWNGISNYVSAYPLAQQKLSKILVKQEKYEEAMVRYKNAGDNVGYAEAWQKVREDILAENFLIIAICLIIGVALLIILLLRLNNAAYEIEDAFYEKTPSKSREFIGLSLMTVFHPIRAFTLLKRTRSRKNMLPIVVLPLLFFVIRILSQLITAFQVSPRSAEDISLIMELLVSIIPLLILGFCIYGITSVFKGEMNLYETFAAMCYSLVPVILFLPLLSGVSYLCAANELAIYNFLNIAIYVWVGLNIVIAVYHLNDIPLKTTVGYCLLSVVGVAIVVILALLLFVFSTELIEFFKSLYAEIQGRF